MPRKPEQKLFLDQIFFQSSQHMTQMPDASVDLVVTSPPYFNVKDYSMDGRQASRHSKRAIGQL